MTSRHVTFTTADEVERHAFESGQPIETTADRAYVRIGCVTYVCELSGEVCS